MSTWVLVDTSFPAVIINTAGCISLATVTTGQWKTTTDLWIWLLVIFPNQQALICLLQTSAICCVYWNGYKLLWIYYINKVACLSQTITTTKYSKAINTTSDNSITIISLLLLYQFTNSPVLFSVCLFCLTTQTTVMRVMEVSSEIPMPAAIPVKPIDHEPALHLYLQILNQ